MNHYELFHELKERIDNENLLIKSPIRTTTLAIIHIFLMFISIGIMINYSDNLIIQILNGIFFAILSVQLALTGHDSSHTQLYKDISKDRLFALFVFTIVGMSSSWWRNKHNLHHDHPNDVELDPDFKNGLLVYTKEEALKRTGMKRFVAKNQYFLLYIFFFVTGFVFVFSSFKFLFKHKENHLGELLLLILRFIAYFYIVFTFMPFTIGLAFIISHYFIMGVYASWIFAPNHKGMKVIDENTKLDYLRMQVLTSRNIKPNFLVDYLYGGLNYQIEHHLFPFMSRKNLKRTREIVKEFCLEKNISYHEVNMFTSFKEIFLFFYEVSSPLRTK